MQMLHALSGCRADICDETKSLRATLGAQARGDLHEVSESFRIRLRRVLKRLAGNDENMHRSLRGDVVKGKAVLVLIDDVRRNFTARDFAKNGFHNSQFETLAPRVLGGGRSRAQNRGWTGDFGF